MKPSSIAFKAIHTESGKVVGHAELDRISRSNGTASLCRMLKGCLRKYVKVGDEFWDLIWMGILKEEWHNCRVTLT